MSDDLIRRSDAIAEIRKARTPDVASYQYAELFINAVYRAPSADRPQGEWVSNHDGSWNCSECGLRVLIYAKGNFCPNCGADMRGEADE